MWTLIIILTGIITAIRLRWLFVSEVTATGKEETNGDVGGFNYIVEQYILPFSKYCITQIYFFYVRCTLANLVTFIVKYVPATVYTYKFVKDIYLRSRKRVKDREIELEELKLQIQIIDTKLLEKDAEFRERAENLRQAVERLRLVRARVREAIASDESLRRVLDAAAVWAADNDLHVPKFSTEEDRESLIELLKEFDYPVVPIWPAEKTELGKKIPTAPNSGENSVYSSLSDGDVRQDCRVRIVRVTNVYKVACLKHYIKQKRLRRITKNTLFKKKMDNITKVLDEWQQALNMVTKNKLTIMNMDSYPLDVASQDAMGDYSKPREFSDTDSEYPNDNEAFDGEYQSNWIHHPPYTSNYEDDQLPKEYFGSQDLVDIKFQQQRMYDMMAIVEETNSQLAIESRKPDGDDDDCDCRH